MSISTTDGEYEADHAIAERTYYLKAIEWLRSLNDAAEKIPQVPAPDPRESISNAWNAGVSGKAIQEIKREPHRIPFHIANHLREVCLAFAYSELTAFFRLLQRYHLPPSQIAKEIDSHRDLVIAEVRARRWNHNIASYAAELFEETQKTFDILWDQLQKDVTAYVAEELEPQLWFATSPGAEHRKNDLPAPPSVQPQVVEESGGIDANKSRIETFLSRVSELAGRKVMREEFWRFAGYTDPTEFQRFQRGSAKTTRAGTRAFTRVLDMEPKDFVSALKRRA